MRLGSFDEYVGTDTLILSVWGPLTHFLLSLASQPKAPLELLLAYLSIHNWFMLAA